MIRNHAGRDPLTALIASLAGGPDIEHRGEAALFAASPLYVFLKFYFGILFIESLYALFHGFPF